MNYFVPVIKIVGVGGGGNNALNNMKEAGIRGAQFVAVNTDSQALTGCRADTRIAIGQVITRGLGAGNDPEVGRRAAEESTRDLRDAVEGADLVFVTAGKGGGTGTGAAPVVAKLARRSGALTVGVVTRPFTFEGPRRSDQAEEGIANLREEVDTLIVIPNDRLLDLEQGIPVVRAFKLADDVLRHSVQAITEMATETGLINVDFADVRHILGNSGSALIGIGHGSGEQRALEAARGAIDSPLLESSIDGATRVILNISGGPDLALYEVNEVAEVVAGSVDPGADIVFGAIVNQSLQGTIKVTVVASGFNREVETRPAAPSGKDRRAAAGNGAEPVDLPSFLRHRQG